MNGISLILTCVFLVSPASAFFDQFFSQQRQQQQQQQREQTHEEIYLAKECSDYLCPDTLSCVRAPIDCPCPFPNSQIKCVLPPAEKSDSDEGSFVCVSKGSRDCKFVLDAYRGLV